jgi:CspA family cold shock protein
LAKFKKVKFFNEAKGFDFIKENSNTEHFLHATGLIDQITEGKRGMNAINFKVV